jgi:hypothetical protein
VGVDMKQFNTPAAFAAGFLTVALVSWLVIDARAQGGPDAIDACVGEGGLLRVVHRPANCGSGQKALRLLVTGGLKPQDADSRPSSNRTEDAVRRRLADLEGRLRALEDDAAHGVLGNKVTEPFQVTTDSGQPIFRVAANQPTIEKNAGKNSNVMVGLYAPFDGRLKAGIVAMSPGGAWFFSNSNRRQRDTRLWMGVQGDHHAGLVMEERDVLRIDLGKADSGRFGLRVFDQAGALSAALGQSVANSGIALAAAQGAVTTRMYVTSGKGTFSVTTGNDSDITVLTEADTAGGLLRLLSSDGTPMVEAVALKGGVGFVGAGPGSFKSGAGILGLPASYVVGKP